MNRGQTGAVLWYAGSVYKHAHDGQFRPLGHQRPRRPTGPDYFAEPFIRTTGSQAPLASFAPALPVSAAAVVGTGGSGNTANSTMPPSRCFSATVDGDGSSGGVSGLTNPSGGCGLRQPHLHQRCSCRPRHHWRRKRRRQRRRSRCRCRRRRGLLLSQLQRWTVVVVGAAAVTPPA
jgi:hypothetical protein